MGRGIKTYITLKVRIVKKILLLTLVLCCLIMLSFGQDKLHLKIVSQYEAPIKEAKLKVLRTGIEYQTTKAGTVSLDASSADSIVLIHEGFNHLPVALSAINDGVLKVEKNFSWKDLLTPMFYIINGGLWFLLFVVFAETGLFAGFFLPGDSLLFVAGIYNKELIGTVFPFVGNEYAQLFLLLVLISVAGILGNWVGYWFGKKVGPTMYHWKDNLLFKKKYLQEAHDFYEKHGGGAIVIARFIPIIRTFAPIVAGIVEMDKKKFIYFNILGCVAWVFSMLVAGHFLQKLILHQFGFDLRSHLEIIVIGIILISTVPVFIKLFGGKKKN